MFERAHSFITSLAELSKRRDSRASTTCRAFVHVPYWACDFYEVQFRDRWELARRSQGNYDKFPSYEARAVIWFGDADVFTRSPGASSLVLFDEGAQAAQGFVPIVRNLG